MIAEKGLACEERDVSLPQSEHKEPWFMRLNLGEEVPVIIHRDNIISDYDQIIDYVERTFTGGTAAAKAQTAPRNRGKPGKRALGPGSRERNRRAWPQGPRDPRDFPLSQDSGEGHGPASLSTLLHLPHGAGATASSKNAGVTGLDPGSRVPLRTQTPF